MKNEIFTTFFKERDYHNSVIWHFILNKAEISVRIHMNTGIFGGTFDPPHSGHMNIAGNILDSRLTDRIIFVPAASPPHKSDKLITGFAHRLNMLKTALACNPRFEVSDIEQKRYPEPSYTFKTMEYFTKIYPGDKLFLIIGGDSLLQLHTWYKAGELAEKWNIITYPRHGETITLEELNKYWPGNLADKLYRSVIDTPLFDISATSIRSMLSDGSEISESLLPAGVLKYIREHALYLFQGL